MKDIKLKYVFIALTLVSLGIFIGIYLNNENEVQINFNHDYVLKDSIGENLIKKEVRIAELKEYERSLNEIIDRGFESSISYINTTAALFGIFLTIFLIGFGLYTFDKMSKSKELLRQILEAPEDVLEKYEKSEIDKYIPELLSKSKTLRSRAISVISGSNYISEEKHFDLITSVIYEELENKELGTLSFNNMVWLFNSLLKLNRERAIKVGFDLFNLHYQKNDINILVELIIENYHKETDQDLLLKIFSSSNKQMINNFLKFQKNHSFWDEKLISHIFKNTDFNTINNLMHKALPLKSVSLIEVFENLNRNDFGISYINTFISYFEKNNELNSRSVEILSNMILESNIDSIQYSDFINNLLKFDKGLNLVGHAIKILTKNEDLDKDQFKKKIESAQNDRLNKILEKI